MSNVFLFTNGEREIYSVHTFVNKEGISIERASCTLSSRSVRIILKHTLTYPSTNSAQSCQNRFSTHTTTTENYCYCQSITMAIKMTPTYGLLHSFQHENDSLTLTLPPLQEEMHFSCTGNFLQINNNKKLKQCTLNGVAFF